MAGNRKFHNKFHSANHHTLPSPHIKDSGLDPVASHDFPFIGDFVLNGVLSASNNYLLNGRAMASTLDSVPHGEPVPAGWNVLRDSTYIDGDMTITGNLSALGEMTYLNTQVTTTSASEIMISGDNSDGRTSALTVDQHGLNDVVHFKNDGISTLLITGSAEGLNHMPERGGLIGINLGNLPGVDRPSQRMTIVGSVSVVGDPGEYLSQTDDLADPGVTGSLYIEGGLHVNDHAFLDQVTIDTTDGKMVVSGGDNSANANSLDVRVPTLLDGVEIDTTQKDFTVTGSNKVYIDADQGLQVDTKSSLGELEIDTSGLGQNGFSLVGGGGAYVDMSKPFDIDSVTTLDKVTVDTKDGMFVVESTQQNVEYGDMNAMVVNVPIELRRVTVDVSTGDTVIDNSTPVAQPNRKVDIHIPTHMRQTVIDTTAGNTNTSTMTVCGTGEVHMNPTGGVAIDTHTSLKQVTIDTTTGDLLINGTGDVNIDASTKLDQVTINTDDGAMEIIGGDTVINDRNAVNINTPLNTFGDIEFSTDTNNTISFSGDSGQVEFNVPQTTFKRPVSILDNLTVDTDNGNTVFNGAGIVDFNNGGGVDTTNTILNAGETNVTLTNEEQLKITGTGRKDDVVIDAGLNIIKPTSIEDRLDVSVTNGDFTVDDDQQWKNSGKFIINVPTRTEALTAHSTNAPIVITGDENDLKIQTPTILSNTVTATDHVRFTGLLDSIGTTELNSTQIDTTDGDFVVGGDQNMFIKVQSLFEQDVRIAGDLTVDGNAYLNADSAGNIQVGDSENDNVKFIADIDSDLTPNADNARSIGSSDRRWMESYVHTANTNIGNIQRVNTNNLDVNGPVDIDTQQGEFVVVQGEGGTIITTKLDTHAGIDAVNGPWTFGGVDEVLTPASSQVINSNLVVTPETLIDPAFHVQCRSLFSHALTATGPVTIGDLNDLAEDGVPQRTLEVLGNMAVTDGNIYMQSDLRHLADETTLIRFEENRICLHVNDVPHICTGDIENNTKPLTKFSSNVSVLGDYKIQDTLGDGVDVHGSMRVTETLSAVNLIVDNITVKGESTGVAPGDGNGVFTALSGVAQEDYTTVIQCGDGTSHEYDAVDTGIEFDILEVPTGKIQKLYSFTFVARHANAGRGIEIGDTQTSTYHFAVKYDEFRSEAIVADQTEHSVHTSTQTMADISYEVHKPTRNTGPWTESVVRIVVRPKVDVDFYIHNVLVQDRPKGIEHISSADFTILGKLDVQGDIEFNNDRVTYNSPVEITHGLDSDLLPIGERDLGSIEKPWNQTVTDTLSATTGNITSLEANDIHVKGDLRVDGNAYLSAGTSGVINVGDNQDDVAVFNAEIASDIIPDGEHALGTEQSPWKTLHVDSISATDLNVNDITWSEGSSTKTNHVISVVESHSGSWAQQTDITQLTSTVHDNSAAWIEQTDITQLTSTVYDNSGDWSRYVDTTELHTTVFDNSAGWSERTEVTQIESDVSYLSGAVDTLSAATNSEFENLYYNQDLNYGDIIAITSYLQNNSGGWDEQTDISQLTNTVQNNSGDWGEQTDISQLTNTVYNNSGDWGEQRDLTSLNIDVDTLSAAIDYNTGSIDALEFTDETFAGLISQLNSAVMPNSANWNTTHDQVSLSADEWNQAYDFVKGNIELLSPTYVQTTFVNSSGGSIDGTLDVIQLEAETLTVDENIQTRNLTVSQSSRFTEVAEFNQIVSTDGEFDSIKVLDTSSDLVPVDGSTLKLGTSSNRWSETHATSGYFSQITLDGRLHVEQYLKLTGETRLAGKPVQVELTSTEEPDPDTGFDVVVDSNGQVTQVPNGNTITTTVTAITAGQPGTVIEGLPMGLDNTGPELGLHPDLDVRGDMAVAGALSADQGYYNSLIARNFISEYNSLTIRDGDLEVLDGNIIQRGGTLRIQSDIGHLEDENTYIRFSPDQMTFRCHDVDMIRLSEFPDFDDTIYIGSVTNPVTFNVLSTAEEYAFVVDGQTGYVGIGTDHPEVELHVASGQVQLASGDAEGALMIPTGDDTTRVTKPGSIRYNTTRDRYEGYFEGDEIWAPIGAIEAKELVDEDRDTYIDVDARETDYETTDSDVIAIYTAGCSAMTIMPNQTVAFAGEIRFDNAPVYDTSEKTPMEDNATFMFVYVNGKRFGIKLWDIPEGMDTNDNLTTIDEDMLIPIGEPEGCHTGLGGRTPMFTLSGDGQSENRYTRLPRFDDVDGDFISDAYDLDDDNDGIPDIADADHPDNRGEPDYDGDSIIDREDPDSDNDGVLDITDMHPLSAADGIGEPGDADGDDIPDQLDPDHVRFEPLYKDVEFDWEDIDTNWEDMHDGE